MLLIQLPFRPRLGGEPVPPIPARDGRRSGPVPPFERITAATTATAAARPREFPHRYLQDIVTLPESRGRGAGAVIFTDRIKSVDVPAYLEARTERSAHLDERCGFTRIGTEIELPDDGPTLRPM
ncbi:hypothetical protein [Nocardia acidivorans]|uniref:hypothetical protein n=1 Tax=Nocardia acidivorans TaxID=404580 RepID=UPI00082D6534|nr:hypothetical protein [Nocardia acidivorans]